MTSISAIDGLTDASDARVMLLQGERQVHAPVLGVGLMRQRTITGTANKITVTNGDGVSGNPTLTIPDAVTLVTPTVTGTLTGQALVDLSGASAGQIKFPASQNASADANTLDDYEEGTWTPALTFGGGATGLTYTTQLGTYVKIGRLVFCLAAITLSAKGSSTGAAVVGGLPFTVATIGQSPAVVTSYSAMAGLTSNPFGTSTTTSLSLFDSSAAAQTALDDTNFTNTSTFRVSTWFVT